ncbi:M4 family metallopeptidase [Pyxidicoccus sp. 3LFB2]
MIRTRILAALFALPLTACGVDGAEPPPDPRPPDALSDIQRSLAAMPGAEVVGRHDDGVPFLVRGRLGEADPALAGLGSAAAHRAISASLPDIASTFRLRAEDLVVSRIRVDDEGFTHIRYNQTKNGLPVRGEELIIHLDAGGNIVMANGTARDGEPEAPSKPRIAAQAARTTALRDTIGRGLDVDGEPHLVYLRAGEGQKLTLAYEVVVTGDGDGLPVRDHVFVDATTGAIAGRSGDIHSALSRSVYSANQGTFLPGTLRRGEGGAVTGDKHVDTNYDLLGFAYNCYQSVFNRDSYDNAGAPLTSTVHYGVKSLQAYWDGSQLVFGDGYGDTMNVTYGPPSRDADMVLHELTHAVTSTESNLIYANESGALNESLSDIFAAACESWSHGWVTSTNVWNIGDDFVSPGYPGNGLRDMARPTYGYYPERYVGTDDYGGVHRNSGIPSLAFQLLAAGGRHPNLKTVTQVPAVGVEKAARIFYKASTDLFTASTTIAQAKTYTAQAASLLGYTAADVDAVNLAWEAVGVGWAKPPPSCTLLQNGVARTGISGAQGSTKYFCMDVPAGRSPRFRVYGGEGVLYMYGRIGTAPTTESYHCKTAYSGHDDATCTIAAQTAAQRIYVMLSGHESYFNVSLRPSY